MIKVVIRHNPSLTRDTVLGLFRRHFGDLYEVSKYRDLIVRVAGYSDYFLDCSADLQNEIIRRTEHMGF